MMRRAFSSTGMTIRHLFALAVPALVVVGSVALEAQRPFNDRDLEKMGMRQLPMLPDDEDERAIVANVRKTPAENLDPALPPMELDAWLAGTLLSYDPNVTPVEWRLDRCEDFTTDVPDDSSELCVVAKSENISPSAEKSLTLILAVGDWSSAAGRWVIRPSAIHDLFIQTDANSLDVRSLGELTATFDVPADRWPTVELKLAVDAVPLRALPGDTVTFRVKVRNTGKRDAPRAEIKFGASFEDMPDDGKEYRYQWFPAIAAGREVVAELPVQLPEGRGIFHASVYAFSSGKRLKATNTSTNSTFLWVHQVTDPPELPAVPPIRDAPR